MKPKINKPHGINQNDFGDVDKIQSFNKAQIYTKGFEYNTTAGTPSNFAPQLGGKARKLHGIVVFSDPNNITDADKMSLVLNSEQLINNVVWWAYNPQGAVGNIFKEGQFFSLPRPLSGADDVQIQWEAINAHKVYIVFYLSDK